MRSKSILLLLVALGCGMVAAVAVSQTLLDRKNGETGETSIEILVATQEIKTASVISADKVKLEKWPKSKVPEGVIVELAQIEGKYARQGIFPNEPILLQKISDSNNSLSTQIPAGHTLFNIKFDNNYIKPGDIVDISGVFKDVKTKKTEVIPVLREIQVFAINGICDREQEHKTGKDTIFQLLIKQNQHQALMLANNLGKLDLNLRPLGVDGEIKGGADNGDSFMAWARENGEESPEPTPEPAKLVSAPAPPAPVVKPEPPRNEIVFVTPDGVTRYEYAGKELPVPVGTNKQIGQKNSNANPWASNSGYGGYTPTYPNTSSTTPAPGTPNNPESSPSGDSTDPAQPIGLPERGL